jgi:CheY-like chemotaxis protein
LAAEPGPDRTPAPRGSPTPLPHPAPAPRPRLLLVEDDRVTYSALRTLFERRGWEVSVATTVSEALGALGTRGQGAPDAVVLDLMLPDGQGEEVLRHIRACRIDARVVVTTGLNDTLRLEQLRAMQPAGVLQKPIDLTQLHQLLARQN